MYTKFLDFKAQFLSFDNQKIKVKVINISIIEEKKLSAQANSDTCGPPPGNKFDLEMVKGQGHGHRMVPIERACHNDHACQVSMLYH